MRQIKNKFKGLNLDQT